MTLDNRIVLFLIGELFTVLRDDGSMMYPGQENAAHGQQSPVEVVDGWMNSRDPRRAILTP